MYPSRVIHPTPINDIHLNIVLHLIKLKWEVEEVSHLNSIFLPILYNFKKHRYTIFLQYFSGTNIYVGVTNALNNNDDTNNYHFV